MNLASLTSIGKIIKPHGIHGEMYVEYFIDIFEKEKLPFLFLELDGLFVPFEIAELRNKSNQTIYIRLIDIDTEIKAGEFSGLKIYVLRDEVDIEKDDELSLDFFIGFRLNDIKEKTVGTIKAIDNTTENILFIVDNQGDEILIPASENHIVEINAEENTILMDLPKGLLDL